MADLTGARLGPFEIEALLGVGGFATVYRAYDPRLRDDVAIKILAENHALNPDVRSRFLSEGLALRRIDSPSVIEIHDVRETPDGKPYLVLEYADRGDLLERRKDRINEDWDPQSEDVRCLIEALGEALDAMHAEQIVHRDVTPANLLIRSSRRSTPALGVAILEPDERILLSDMGLAKDLTDGSGLTLGGGTAGFAAPEQAKPLADIDSRTDIYAASAVVVWFLTGHTVSGQPNWPKVLKAGGWPPSLIASLERGLADDPDQRPSSALEWRRLMIAALNGQVDSSAFAPRRADASQSTRNRLAIGSILAIAAALAIALFVRAGTNADPDAALEPVEDQALIDQESVTDDDDTDGSADQAEVVTTQVEVDADTSADQADGETELIIGYDESEPDPNRERANLFEPSPDPIYGSMVTRINTANPSQQAIDSESRRQIENADGTLLLTFHGEGNGFQINTRDDGTLIRNLRIQSEMTPHWHPTDPNRVRYLAGGELKLNEVDVNSGEENVLVDLTERVQATFPNANYLYQRVGGAPSADGSRYAWFVFSHEVEEPVGAISYDVSTDTILGRLPVSNLPNTGRNLGIAMSPTGNYVVAGQGDGSYVYDADLTNERFIYPATGFSDLALNSDGKDSYVYVSYGGADGGWLISVDLETLTKTRIFNLFEDANTLMEISGRGFAKPGWIVASSHDCKHESAWTCDKVMAVELEPDGRVVNLAHTYSCTSEPWYQPQAVPNRDFSRIYFTSDNGVCGSDAELMMIDVPAFG